jgi:hypothetical protein
MNRSDIWEEIKKILYIPKEGVLSGISWNGFNLLGNEQSIAEVRRLMHNSENLQMYEKSYNHNLAKYEKEISELKSEISILKEESERK